MEQHFLRSGMTMVLLFLAGMILGQKPVYSLDLRNVGQAASARSLSFEATSPDGRKLSVNNHYFQKNGQPWFPLMGEFQYARYPEAYWEEEILKMKSAGLVIIATYVFWNVHEYPQGVWNWCGNRNLREFVQLCQKHGLYVWLRIGPWCHGEQLYGGFPEWIDKMEEKRNNDPDYLNESRKLYEQIGIQTRGLYFKDGGPIIGVQLENEYAYGDIDHIGTLKEIAIEAHIFPVYWSVTGNTVFHDNQFEAIPLQGAYPYRGWERGGGRATKDFLYANDQWIMTDALGTVYYDVTKYPRGLCEQGCGSQMTYNNRFVIDPVVIEAHLQNQIGRGMNLIGYYIFQGGTQVPGLKEPGCPESYDFQAPISEFGFIRPSYKYLKILHNFIHDFGGDLARTTVVEPQSPVRNEYDTLNLRYVARIYNNKGFVFLCNTQVRVHMPDKDFKMQLFLPDETIEFPRGQLHLKGQTTAILPFNLDVNGALVKYATAQPICRFNKGKEQYLFLTEIEGMGVELAFDKSTIKSVLADGWRKEDDNKRIYLFSESGSVIQIIAASGQKSTIVVLTRKQAESCWRLNIDGQESVILTNADVMMDRNQLVLRELNNTTFEFGIFPGMEKNITSHGHKLISDQKGLFLQYTISIPSAKTGINISNLPDKTATILLPEKFPQDISDVFLDIDYWGGSMDATIKDKVVTDHLFSGPSWQLGLKRFLNSRKKQSIDLAVYPWSDRITGVDPALVNDIKKHPAQINSIVEEPQYQVTVQWK